MQNLISTISLSLSFISLELTLRFIRSEWLVGKAKNLSEIVEIWMLSNKCPLCIIVAVVKIRHSNLNTPILLVIDLDMPMNSNWAHVLCALKQWGIIYSRCVYPHNT